MKNFLKVITAATILLATSLTAQAHVWYIGWNANTNGTVDFYGLSYHSSLSSSYDDFTANPAGIVLNGVQFGFDAGSVVDLADCYGLGTVTGSCDTTWNALALDAGIASTSYSTENYGKYAVRHMSQADLTAAGIVAGSNTVSFTTFANNAHWDGLNFATSGLTTAITVIVNNVPEPSTLAIMALGLLGFQLRRRNK